MVTYEHAAVKLMTRWSEVQWTITVAKLLKSLNRWPVYPSETFCEPGLEASASAWSLLPHRGNTGAEIHHKRDHDAISKVS